MTLKANVRLYGPTTDNDGIRLAEPQTVDITATESVGGGVMYVYIDLNPTSGDSSSFDLWGTPDELRAFAVKLAAVIEDEVEAERAFRQEWFSAYVISEDQDARWLPRLRRRLSSLSRRAS